jgi:pilus assembly protein FimV
LPTEIPSPQEKGAAQAPGEELPFEAQGRATSIESTGDEPLTFSWASETAEPEHEPLFAADNEPASPLATPEEPVIDWAVSEPESEGQARLPEPPPTTEAKTVPPVEEVLLPDLDFELETSAEQLAPPTSSATPPTDERSIPPLPEVHETGAETPGEGEGASSTLSSERIAAGEPPTTSERVDLSELPTLDLATVMEQPEVPEVAEEEIDSRIQLAKAYLEMEDYEGARELLDEVIREGPPEAKARAEALLAQLPM